MRLVFLFLLHAVNPTQAQITRYKVKLTPDLDHQLLHAQETIEFQHDAGTVELHKQSGLQLLKTKSPDADVTLADESLTIRLRRSGKHLLHFEYTAAPHRGIKWFADQPGFDTAFYCDTWMICDNSPSQRATLTLEIVLRASSGMAAVGPGRLKKQWHDAKGEHFLFEQDNPVQTYLFSFGVAKLIRSTTENFVIYALDSTIHQAAFSKTAEALAFLRSKAGVDLADAQYTQAFLPGPIEQEAAGLALLPASYLPNLENDQVSDMTHELAHQWWGVLVGIRSWSDFWLNEGMADFMTAAYLEQHNGKAAYDEQIAAAQKQMDKLRAEGHDRPLHWEAWKDAHEALGRIPYVKGALFLDRLRKDLGEEKFWRGIQLYTTRNAGRLVDSHDFQQAMEDASHSNLKSLFDEAVYH
ncbi:MAG: M1 family aminopeptidase [Candidatus Acidiferrales bacterium]